MRVTSVGGTAAAGDGAAIGVRYYQGHHGEVIEMSRVLARYTIVDDIVADARRAEDTAWRDLHRRPDALPEPPAIPEPPATPGPGRSSRFTMGSFVRRLTGLRPGPG